MSADSVSALRFISDGLAVGRQMNMEAVCVCVMLVNWFLLELVNVVKGKQQDGLD